MLVAHDDVAGMYREAEYLHGAAVIDQVVISVRRIGTRRIIAEIVLTRGLVVAHTAVRERPGASEQLVYVQVHIAPYRRDHMLVYVLLHGYRRLSGLLHMPVVPGLIAHESLGRRV